MVEYRFATIPELGAALRARAVSPQELTQAALDALARIGPRFNGVAALLPERAQAEARRADRRLHAGEAPLLCGIPYGVKDLFSARGGPTTWGAPPFRDRVIDEDAVAVRRLRRAGGVLAAKLAMVELAGAGRARIPGASLHGQGRNPWDPSRYSGGSSSGSAIAVAAGLLPYALGSETGGSIVGPAAFSGVTGLRPSYGLVPRTGAMLISRTLDKLGPLARTADDVATVLEAISGPDARDCPRVQRFRPLSGSDARDVVTSIRVAFLDEEMDEWAPTARRALARGADELRGVGLHLVPTGMRRDLPYGQTLETIMLAESAFELAPHIERPDFTLADPGQLAELRQGLTLTAREYQEALRAREAIVAEFGRVFREVDAILTASRTGTAPSLDDHRVRRASSSMSDQLRAAANVAGMPGVSFPCGFAEDGLPVGLQLIGPRGSDARLLAVASAYQRRTDHHLKRPPLSDPPAAA